MTLGAGTTVDAISNQRGLTALAAQARGRPWLRPRKPSRQAGGLALTRGKVITLCSINCALLRTSCCGLHVIVVRHISIDFGAISCDIATCEVSPRSSAPVAARRSERWISIILHGNEPDHRRETLANNHLVSHAPTAVSMNRPLGLGLLREHAPCQTAAEGRMIFHHGQSCTLLGSNVPE